MLKNASLDKPEPGKVYWVIRYAEELDPSYSLLPSDFHIATFMGEKFGKARWKHLTHKVSFYSDWYMEVPKL